MAQKILLNESKYRLEAALQCTLPIASQQALTPAPVAAPGVIASDH